MNQKLEQAITIVRSLEATLSGEAREQVGHALVLLRYVAQLEREGQGGRVVARPRRAGLPPEV
jgi:hypothetical protein